MSRVLKDATNQITCPYGYKGHVGVDVVKYKGQLAYIIAHTEGTVIEVVKNYNRTDKSGHSYGNYVLLRHPNGYYTLYAHMKYGSVKVSKGQWVEKGQTIGYMGNTGYSQGAHLHFEVRDRKNKRINPTPYLDSNLPSMINKTVSYRVFCNNHWFDTTKDGGRAGNGKDVISGIQMRTGVGCGKTKYRVHVKGGKWLEEVTYWGKDGDPNGYAGIYNKPIDMFTCWSEHGDAKYRVQTKEDGWLPWIVGKYGTTKYSDYAGIKGHSIVAVEIQIV